MGYVRVVEGAIVCGALTILGEFLGKILCLSE